MVDPALEPIRDALEAAFALAQREASVRGAPPAPRALVPVLRFKHLPDRALANVRQAVDSDDAFRARVLSELDGQELGDSLDEGARLFLARPDGWREALEILTEDAVDAANRTEGRRREEDASNRLQQLEGEHAELAEERDRLAVEAESLRRELDAHARASSRSRAALEAATREVETLRDARAEAIRQLKDSESLAVQRLERSRELEAELDDLRSAAELERDDSNAPLDTSPASDARSVDSAGPAPEHPGRSLASDVAPSVVAAAEAASGLAAALEGIAASLAGDRADPTRISAESASAVADSVGAVARGDSGPASRGRAQRQRRRRPVRLGRGLSVDSSAGLAELLSRADSLVLVDGYNVSMKGWPAQVPSDQRRSLLSMLGAMGSIAAAKIHVVFDGAYDGERPAVGAPLPVRVHFTESGVEADDRLLAFVDEAPPDAAVVVVSSDHRVRDGARERGANAVSSETLLARGRGR